MSFHLYWQRHLSEQNDSRGRCACVCDAADVQSVTDTVSAPTSLAVQTEILRVREFCTQSSVNQGCCELMINTCGKGHIKGGSCFDLHQVVTHMRSSPAVLGKRPWGEGANGERQSLWEQGSNRHGIMITVF